MTIVVSKLMANAARQTVASTSIRRPGSLGHGAILDEPSVWRRILGVVGPQSQLGTPSADPIEAELKALKDRLRREGRIA